MINPHIPPFGCNNYRDVATLALSTPFGYFAVVAWSKLKANWDMSFHPDPPQCSSKYVDRFSYKHYAALTPGKMKSKSMASSPTQGITGFLPIFSTMSGSRWFVWIRVQVKSTQGIRLLCPMTFLGNWFSCHWLIEETESVVLWNVHVLDLSVFVFTVSFNLFLCPSISCELESCSPSSLTGCFREM